MLADAFFVAFRIPNTFRRLFAEGTFNAAFVPSYSSEIFKGKKQSNKFANDIFNLLFLGLLFLTIIIEIFMPAFVSIIAPGFVGDLEKMEVAINLTRITFPFLLFICLASFFSAILNSHNKFAAAANLLCEFKIAEKNEAKQIKNKKGKVILVKLIASSIFSKSPTNPGAIIETNAGMKISIIIVKNNNPKKRRLKISLANLFDCFFPLVISDE